MSYDAVDIWIGRGHEERKANCIAVLAELTKFHLK